MGDPNVDNYMSMTPCRMPGPVRQESRDYDSAGSDSCSLKAREIRVKRWRVSGLQGSVQAEIWPQGPNLGLFGALRQAVAWAASGPGVGEVILSHKVGVSECKGVPHFGGLDNEDPAI